MIDVATLFIGFGVKLVSNNCGNIILTIFTSIIAAFLNIIALIVFVISWAVDEDKSTKNTLLKILKVYGITALIIFIIFAFYCSSYFTTLSSNINTTVNNVNPNANANTSTSGSGLDFFVSPQVNNNQNSLNQLPIGEIDKVLGNPAVINAFVASNPEAAPYASLLKNDTIRRTGLNIVKNNPQLVTKAVEQY